MFEPAALVARESNIQGDNVGHFAPVYCPVANRRASRSKAEQERFLAFFRSALETSALRLMEILKIDSSELRQYRRLPFSASDDVQSDSDNRTVS